MFLLSALVIFLFTFFLSFLLAIVNVFMRDTQFIVQFAVNLAYFVTPIFYPKELIPEKYQWLIDYNPLYICIRPFQSIFWKYNSNTYVTDMLSAIGVLIILIAACLLYWRRKKNEIYFKI